MSRKLRPEDFKIPEYHADTFLTKHDDLPITPMKRVDSIEYDSKKTLFVPKQDLEAIKSGLLKHQSSQIQPTKEAQLEKARFLKAIQDFKHASGDGTNLDLLGKSSWDDLVQYVENMSKLYQNVGDSSSHGFRGKIRRGFRNIAKYQESAKSLLELLPGDAWQASLVVGSLKLIFDAAGRLQQMRDETYDMIEQIPQTIHKAERLLRTYDDSEKLKQLASKLYISILQGLAAILNWYKVKSAKKVFKSMIGRDSGAQEIQESLERLKKLETEIDGEASLQGHERLDEVQQMLTTAASSSMLGAVYGNEILGLLRDEESFKTYVMSQLRFLSSRELALQQEKQAEEGRPPSIKLPNLVKYDDLIDGGHPAHFSVLGRVAHLPSSSDEKLDRMYALNQRNRRHLLAAIKYDHGVLLNDRQVILRNGLALAEEERGRAYFFLKAKLFLTWLSCETSAVLVLNAHCKDDEGKRISSASLFCAMLASSIETNDEIASIIWFCGNHLPQDSPRLMVSSLIGQILTSRNCAVNVSGISPQTISTIGHQMAPDMLVWLLTTVIRQQLEASPVVLVLDGLSFYEARQHLDCASLMVRALTELTREESKHPFKILITSPTQMTRLSSAVVNAAYLNFVDGQAVEMVPAQHLQSLMYAQTQRGLPNRPSDS